MKKSRIVCIVLVVLGVLLFALVAWFFVLSISEKRALIASGVEVKGSVLGQDVSINYAGTGSFARHSIDYSFTPVDSQKEVIKRGYDISVREYRKLATSGEISITYLPENTLVNEPTGSIRRIPQLYELLIILAGVFGSLYALGVLSQRLTRTSGKKKLGLTRWRGFLRVLRLVAVTAIAAGVGVSVGAALVQGINISLF